MPFDNKQTNKQKLNSTGHTVGDAVISHVNTQLKQSCAKQTDFSKVVIIMILFCY